MMPARRFPLPWSVEGLNGWWACLSYQSAVLPTSQTLTPAERALLDHIRGAASAGKRQHHFRLAFGQHLTIADQTSPGAKLPPIGVEDLHRHALKSGPVVRCGVS